MNIPKVLLILMVELFGCLFCYERLQIGDISELKVLVPILFPSQQREIALDYAEYLHE